MRFDGHRYVHCKWCAGRGCLQCEVEADRAYKAAFPEGPKPVATFKLNDPAQLAEAKELLGPDAMRKHFGPGGGGVEALIASLAGKNGGR